MNSFTAIDFETAQGKRWSICQVGLVSIANGVITKTINQLVRPPDNFYFNRNIDIHGITPGQTKFAPTFAQVWDELLPYIQDKTLVAHHGAFDFNCLAQTLDYYGLEHPNYLPQCTYKIYRRNLASLCIEHDIPLNHHDALSDALACAELYKLYLNKMQKMFHI